MVPYEIIYWSTAALSLLGVWLNIRKKIVCFWIWMVTNATWAVIDFAHGIYAQSALQASYFALAVYGVFVWSRGEGRAEKHRNKQAL